MYKPIISYNIALYYYIYFEYNTRKNIINNNCKMKFLTFNIILFILFISLLLSFISSSSTDKTWCWTRNMSNEPSFSLKTKYGGMNWGFCQKTPSSTTKYFITLITSNLPLSGTTSKLSLQLKGTNGQTPFQEISNTPLESGSEYEYNFETKNIGTVKKAILKLDGQVGYRCKKITIKKDNYVVSFDCLKKLEPCDSTSSFKCQMELLAEGAIPYEINLRTAEDKNAGIDVPILFGIIGSKGKSNMMLFSENGMKSGQSKTSVINYDDVEHISGYQIEIMEKGTFTFTFISIKNTITEEVKEFHVGDVTLSNPGKSNVIFDENNKNGINGSSGGAGERGGLSMMFDIAEKMDALEEENDDEDDTDDISTSSDSISSTIDTPKNFGFFTTGESASPFNLNDPDGGVISPNEKTTIIDLSCTQPMVNPSQSNKLFGPNFVNGKGNYMNFLARCPGDCHKIQGVVYGSGLHPNTSPICLSALVDGAMSFYGGIISISVFPGLENYPINEKNNKNYKLIDIQSSQTKAEKSFSCAKVDNVDLVEKDIRILNDKGQISNEGRVEFRLNGIWGSICAKGNNAESAIRICKDLGYKNGNWINTEENIEICRQYNGGDYCGAEGTRIHFSHIECTSNDKSINTCNKQFAKVDQCTKNTDAIISCNNVNRITGDNIPNYTVKLEDITTEGDVTTGRVELSQNKKWLPICSQGTNEKSAEVLCKQMGFISGQVVKNENEASKYRLDDKSNTPFSASDIKCSGKENKVTQCKAKFTSISCKHTQDLIIKCKGNTGDYTGLTQYQEDKKVPLPGLGKLGIPKYRITCTTTGEDELLRGDIGSVFLLLCPRDCAKVSGTVTGTGIYTKDSSICRSAIHAGVIKNKKGGMIALAKLQALNEYIGTKKNEVTTNDSKQMQSGSFSVFKVNSGWRGMWNIIKRNLGGSYIEKEAKVAYKAQSSFLETSYEPIYYPNPYFKWIEEDTSHSFSDKKESTYLLNSNNKKTLRTFTFIASVTLSEAPSSEKSFIYSTNSCGGFNVYMEENTLIIGDPCNTSRKVNTELSIGLNDKTLIYVTYNMNILKVFVLSEGYAQPLINSFEDIVMSIEPSEVIGIGRASETERFNFNGKIGYIGVFDSLLKFDKVKLFIDDVESMKYTAKEEADKEITKDNRECVSKCIGGPTPEQDGTLEPPRESIPDTEDEVPTPSSYNESDSDDDSQSNFGNDNTYSPTSNFNPSSNRQEYTSSSGYSGYSNNQNGEGYNIGYSQNEQQYYPNQNEEQLTPTRRNNRNEQQQGVYNSNERQLSSLSLNINCETTLLDPIIATKSTMTNKIYVKCPSNCINSKAKAYGTITYHPESSICTAGYHMGAKSEYLEVHIIKGYQIYQGSKGKNNIETYNKSAASQSFTVSKSIAPKSISCTETLETLQVEQKEIGDKILLFCPSKCILTHSIIYGTKIYTDNSPICISAIHSGVISQREGGEIEIEIKPYQSEFIGSKGISIVSKSYYKQRKCYTFIGSKFEGSTSYKELFNQNIYANWENKLKEKNEDDSVWKFDSISIANYAGKALAQVKAIHHIGTKQNIVKEEYTSMLILKSSELSKGIFKSKFMFDMSKEPFAFIFGYEDNDNYYSIHMDPSKITQNIKLIQKSNSLLRTLHTSYFTIIPKKWYQINIILNHNQIIVDIHLSSSYEQHIVLTYETKDIIHGKIGFSSNGNSSLFITDIVLTQELKINKKKLNNDINNKRTWNELINSLDNRSMTKYCIQFIEQSKKEKCNTPSTFCEYKCNEYVDPIENIMHYACVSDCRKKLRTIKSINN